uniref:Uncharacterized protein n=2 Tax=Avena sativa TaxID=4498 RepID=A0ACD5VA85_AVESA
MSAQDDEMTPATAPLENDDLLSEILIRLPPQPSSLPRASAVCKRWLGLVSSPGFVRSFRLRHRRNPPVLGYIHQAADDLRFEPTMDPPNRVPRGCFSLQLDGCWLLGCHHGLVLAWDASRDQVLLWDPITGDQRRVAAPPGFDMDDLSIGRTVLRAAGDHFQVVLLGYAQEQNLQFAICFYSSETGLWSNLIETPVAGDTIDSVEMPAVLVGDSLYWLLCLWGTRDPSVVLQFDLDRQSLTVVQMSKDMFAEDKFWMAMRAEGGGLGLLSLSGYTVQLWKRNTDCDGVSSWVLRKTIDLGRLLALDSKRAIIMYAEENNVVFLHTVGGIFMVNLETLHFNKLPEINIDSLMCYSLESVYAAETSIGAGHDGADQHTLVR